MNAQDSRVAEFRRLHTAGCFVMPNPWDVGSARALEQMGFKALASTSAGLAWTLGRTDAQVTLEEALEHLRALAQAVTVPVNADFEGGYAVDPQDVQANVTLAVATGIAGLSIEDSTHNENDPLFDFDLAVERIRAARRAIDESGTVSFSPLGRRDLWWDARTSTRRFEGSAGIPTPAPTASMLLGSAPSSRFPRSSPRWRPNP